MQMSARADTAAARSLSGLQPHTGRERENSPAKPEQREQPEVREQSRAIPPLLSLLEGSWCPSKGTHD